MECSRACGPQLESPRAAGKTLHDATKILPAATKTRCSKINKYFSKDVIDHKLHMLKAHNFIQFGSVQLLSHVWLFVTPWTAARQPSLSITNSRNLLKFMSIKSLIPSNHLILHHPLLLLPSIFPSIRVCCNKSALCIRWLKYWSFSFSISPFNEYSGLISFRIDWLELLAIQGALKSLL